MKYLSATLLLLLLFSVSTIPATAQQTPTDLPPPVELTTEEDHKRTLELLGIDSLRPGVNGNDPDAPNYVNYTEEGANPYPHLPDPLLTKSREEVTTPEMWRDERRPELTEFFDREIYGRIPEKTPAVKWEITEVSDTTIGNIQATKKRLVGQVDNSAYPHISVNMDAVLVVPAGTDEAVPVIMQFGFIELPPFLKKMMEENQDEGEEDPAPNWHQLVMEKGWGYAIIEPNSIQPDNGAGLTKGIIGLTNKGQPRDLDDWGALRAWAWGGSRLLDYFETASDVDATQVGIQGHSRYGKAAVVALAYDQRFAIGHISSSGAGGVKLHRRNFGEIVENVAAPSEYHWMAGNYLKYAGPLTWRDIPVDSHELLALCAPRPVFIGSGKDGDLWVDPKGMFMAGVAAGPVYELLGEEGVSSDEFPQVGTALLGGDIAFRQHPGGHTSGPNWPAFIKFADRYLD